MKTETILFDTVVPCPTPVHLADLLTEIETVIKNHVVLNDHAAAALAVWVLHTYTFELRDTVAYVAIESPEKRCGKTTLLSVLAAMAHRPLISSNITVGALFRAIHNCSPTLFADEADTFLAGNSIVRGIINSGNTRRTAYVLRLVGRVSRLSETRTVEPSPTADPAGRAKADGAAIETGIKKYSCWCPKVIALIGEAPDTIADRSIVVKMARKLTTETCAPLSALNTADIRAKCARFALDVRDSIAQSPKISGAGLNDRAADTFDPLYVIARHAGSGWEEKLHAAALHLNLNSDSKNSGSGLILDILDIFADTCREKMFSRDIITLLREGGMKSQTIKDSAINEFQISRALRQYHIRPSSIRIGKEVSRGYLCSDFRDAYKRYVSEADAKARIQEIQRRWQLQEEVSVQVKKETELRQKLMALAEKEKKLGPEAWAILDQLNNMQKMDDSASPPPTEDQKENNVPASDVAIPTGL